MNILDKIVAHKWKEIEAAKKHVSLKELESSKYFDRECISLKQNLLLPTASGIIAEFKRKSPSKGILNAIANPVEVVKGYEAARVSGSSILTDAEFFGGSPEDLKRVREAVKIPLLRKDFMVDEYQFLEAKAWGADVVLLIAAILSPKRTKELALFAKSLGLETILELHGEEELDHINDSVHMVGINNRNLKTFEVDIERSIRMSEQIDIKFVKIAESGIDLPNIINYFWGYGFKGFLIGENFMKTDDPALACKIFIENI